MSEKSKLQNALNAIDDAERALKRAMNESPNPECEQQIRRALREIDDAACALRQALSAL